MAKQYTKNLIKCEFLALLEEKSFHNITIAMLAERCEISRNTFYYHYEDIYTLVKEILQDELAGGALDGRQCSFRRRKAQAGPALRCGAPD